MDDLGVPPILGHPHFVESSTMMGAWFFNEGSPTTAQREANAQKLQEIMESWKVLVELVMPQKCSFFKGKEWDKHWWNTKNRTDACRMRYDEIGSMLIELFEEPTKLSGDKSNRKWTWDGEILGPNLHNRYPILAHSVIHNRKRSTDLSHVLFEKEMLAVTYLDIVCSSPIVRLCKASLIACLRQADVLSCAERLEELKVAMTAWMVNMRVSINGGIPRWMVYKGRTH